MLPIVRIDVQADAVACFEDHTRRPDLDFDRHDFSGRQLLLLVMGVIRAIGCRQQRVEFAMGHLKNPTRCRLDRPVRRHVAKIGEHIHVVGLR